MAKYKFIGNDRIVSKHWAVELVDLGEGLRGDYNPEDPNDMPLLRFDMYSRENSKSDWETPNDSSYCTCLDANIGKKERHLALKYLLMQVIDLDWDESVKKLGERLSHIQLSWLK